MSVRRTTVWERKRPYIRPPDSPAAKRVRARLKPSAITRITDRFFDWWEALDARVSTYADDKQNWLARSSLAIGAFSVLFVVFIFQGETGYAVRYFGTLAVLAFAARAYYAWHKRNPVSPPDRITSREEWTAVAHGMLASAAMFLGQWLTASSLRGTSFDAFPTVVVSIVLGAGVFRIRTTDVSDEEGSRSRQGGGSLLLLLLFFGAYVLAS